MTCGHARSRLERSCSGAFSRVPAVRGWAYVDHVTGRGTEFFEHVQAVGAEGIVSKRIGSHYRGGPSRDWLKTKCHAMGSLVITGFQELGPGRLEALHVA